MKAITIFILVLFTSILNAQTKWSETPKNYTLSADDDGILVEQFDSTIVDENRYTENNQTFKEGVSFIYSFEHIDTKNEKYFFTYIDSLSNWEFVPVLEADGNTIKEVVITVENGLQPFIKFIPDYNQTVISYTYPTENGGSGFGGSSGVIENEANIWMHPPRDKYFEILELNPFPYIKAPYEIGNTWDWTLTIGQNWADSRWKMWEGKIQNDYEYQITDKKILDSKVGEIECLVIESKAKSRIGETKLTAYFNPEYGFIQLNYINIDGSRTNLMLTKLVAGKNSR